MVQHNIKTKEEIYAAYLYSLTLIKSVSKILWGRAYDCLVVLQQLFSEVPHRPSRMRLWYSGPGSCRKRAQNPQYYEYTTNQFPSAKIGGGSDFLGTILYIKIYIGMHANLCTVLEDGESGR